jgi:hypothetical protein
MLLAGSHFQPQSWHLLLPESHHSSAGGLGSSIGPISRQSAPIMSRRTPEPQALQATRRKSASQSPPPPTSRSRAASAEAACNSGTITPGPSQTALKDSLRRFYNNFASDGRGPASSISTIAAFYRNDRTALNKALKQKYGYSLEDLDDLDPTLNYGMNVEIYAKSVPAAAFERAGYNVITTATAPRSYSQSPSLATLPFHPIPDSCTEAADRHNPVSKKEQVLLKEIDKITQHVAKLEYQHKKLKENDPGKHQMFSKGRCGCCAFEVMLDEPFFNDGEGYFHRQCWERLVAHIEEFKQKMHETQRDAAMQRAIQRGLQDEIVQPLRQKQYSLQNEQKMNSFCQETGSDLLEEEEEEEETDEDEMPDDS